MPLHSDKRNDRILCHDIILRVKLLAYLGVKNNPRAIIHKEGLAGLTPNFLFNPQKIWWGVCVPQVSVILLKLSMDQQKDRKDNIHGILQPRENDHIGRQRYPWKN